MSGESTLQNPVQMPSQPGFLISNPIPKARRSARQTNRTRVRATVSPPATARPEAGLITARGTTGTVCANLWPLPVLGGYSWFLNVYRRDAAASVGPFTVTGGDNTLRMEFREDRKAAKVRSSKHQSFRGVVTGNINVRRAVEEMNATRYQLKLFEKGDSENFLQRWNEIHALPEEEAEAFDVWNDPAPTYRTINRASSFEVREVYAGCGASPRATAPFEYFAMNLFPIFPFAAYSCVVAVWKQRNGLSPVAIDKRGKEIHLSFFDPLELVQNEGDTPTPIAKFAVKVFYGAVTDATAAAQHRALLDAVASSPSTRVSSQTDFRLVVDNAPGTVAPNRRNEIWVQVE